MNGEYYERQRSPWTVLIGLIVVIQVGVPGFAPMPFPAKMTLILSAGLVAVIGVSFAELVTEDTGETLQVRFGPFPLASTEVTYEEIVEVERDRSTVIDGWGLRYARGGWLWNTWGFDCIKIVTKKKTIRIGTQKPDEFLEFLLLKTGVVPPDDNFS